MRLSAVLKKYYLQVHLYTMVKIHKLEFKVWKGSIIRIFILIFMIGIYYKTFNLYKRSSHTMHFYNFERRFCDFRNRWGIILSKTVDLKSKIVKLITCLRYKEINRIITFLLIYVLLGQINSKDFEYMYLYFL